MTSRPLLLIDAGALATVLGSSIGYLPELTALLAAIYYAIQIWDRFRKR